MHVISSIADLRRHIAGERSIPKRIGFVPTMGALHAGHLSLVDASREVCDATVASIFVNPLQFGPNEDYAKYPRQLEDDYAKLAERGVDVIFAPSAELMYPPQSQTVVEVPKLAELWEGPIRPGHFLGVTTVVMKLFQIVQPDTAFFGQKDFQQAAIIRRMVLDLNVPIEVVVCPTIREADGLAMSSRNVYLTPEQRSSAVVLSRALFAVNQLVQQGERQAEPLLQAMQQTFATEPNVQVEYIGIADPQSLQPVSRIEDNAIALVAAKVGTTRLLDNLLLQTRDS